MLKFVNTDKNKDKLGAKPHKVNTPKKTSVIIFIFNIQPTIFDNVNVWDDIEDYVNLLDDIEID